MIVPLVVLGATAILLVYEFWAIFTGHKLITMIVRDAVRAYPEVGCLVSLATGLIWSHLFWP